MSQGLLLGEAGPVLERGYWKMATGNKSHPLVAAVPKEAVDLDPQEDPLCLTGKHKT